MIHDATIAKIRQLVSNKEITIVDNNQTYEFSIKPISGKVLAQISALEGIENLDGKEGGGAMKSVYPLIQIVIPACTVDPPIIDDYQGDKEENKLYLEDIPLNILTDLLTQIFSASGLDDKDDTAKN